MCEGLAAVPSTLMALRSINGTKRMPLLFQDQRTPAQAGASAFVASAAALILALPGWSRSSDALGLKVLIRTAQLDPFRSCRIPWLVTLLTSSYCAGASVAATPSFVLADVTGTEQSSRYCTAILLCCSAKNFSLQNKVGPQHCS